MGVATVPKKLDDAIRESGLTQMQIAVKARVGLSTLHRAIAGIGKHGPERKTREDIAAALGMTADEIIWPMATQNEGNAQ